MTNRILLALIAFALMASIAAAAGSVTADLMQTGVGARPLGMGKAFTGVADGSNAIAFNPAGIGFTPSYEVTVMQTKVLNVIDYKMYGGVYATSYGNVGLNYIMASSPAGYATTDKASMTGAQAMNYRSSLLTLTYARNMNKVMRVSSGMGDLALGANLKVIRNEMSGVMNGSGAGIDGDVGLILLAPKDYTIGVTLQNILRGSVNWGSGNQDKLPATLRLGGTYKLKNQNILLAGDAEMLSEDHHPILLHVGGEWTPMEMISIRAGIDQDALNQTEVINNMTFGLGLKYSGVSFDYSYRQNGLQSDRSNQYLSISFSPVN